MLNPRLALYSGLVLSFGCRDSVVSVDPRSIAAVTAQITDAAHNGGPAHFYFLPPIVAAPSGTATFDASVAPFTAVEICEWTGSTCVLPLLARFTTTSGPGSETIRVDIDSGDYVVNWHTGDFSLSTEQTYRIRVLVAGAELGHADVDVVASGKDLRNVETGEYVGLVDDRTLPIKFRIEPGAVFVLGPGATTVQAAGGAITLVVPAGAVSEPSGVIVGPAAAVPPDAGLVPGTSVALGPDTLSFAAPATLTIAYRPVDVPVGVDESTLRLHCVGEGAWVEIYDGRVLLDTHAATGSIDRLGTCAVLPERAVAAVTVTPAVAQLDVGAVVRLRATPHDALGNLLVRPVTWTSSAPEVATVDGGGLITGMASGLATVTAASGGATSSATVTVRNAAYPHEPAGFTRVTERGFAAREEAGWHTTSSENLQIVEDPTAPQSPPSVMQLQYPAGFRGGDAPGWTEFGDISYLGHRRVYVSFWIKLSDDWQGHDTFVNKVMYLWQHGKPVFFAQVTGKDDGPLTTRLSLQDIPILIARNLDPNLVNVPVARGQWHRWEIVLISNTGDDANGEAHWWIDGLKVGEYRDVMYHSSLQSDLWAFISYYPIWGGDGDVVLDTMYLWTDHFYASGSP